MKSNGNIQYRNIKNIVILLLIVITSIKAKADNYEIIIEPYLENQPTSVILFQKVCLS